MRLPFRIFKKSQFCLNGIYDYCTDLVIYYFFQGQWRNDVFNGEGTMLHSSGMTYDGMWENGIPAGNIHIGNGRGRGVMGWERGR